MGFPSWSAAPSPPRTSGPANWALEPAGRGAQTRAMTTIYLQHRPPPPLAAFVETLWYWEGAPPPHRKDVIMPSPAPALLISMTADELDWYDGDSYATRNVLRGIAITGTQARSFAINAHQPRMMGVKFRPGGAWPFFGPGASAFHNTHLSLDDLWGRDAERLQQRLIQAPTPADKFRILEAALIAKAARPFAHHPAVALALHAFTRRPRVSVAATAREAEVSAKRFIHLFTQEVGMAPKAYLRIGRFHKVLARIVHAPHVDWAETVERAGYYDQSHFIREFREFSGLTPSEYVRRCGPYADHVPLT
jgi:AraC-like DNA-binding protein